MREWSRDPGAATVASLGWQDRARCVGTSSDVFFPEGGDTRRAKAFCAGCQVWSECLLYGLDEDHGIWGGLNRAERARLRRLRHRLSTAPTHRANAVDIARLVSVGLIPERLSEVSGLAVETIIDVVESTGGGTNGRRNPGEAAVEVPLPQRGRTMASVGAGV
jgi:WhiB family transcriptional regulator, redox-sensing transcriptional regulator